MEEDSVIVATHLLRAYSGCCTRCSGNKDKKGVGCVLKELAFHLGRQVSAFTIQRCSVLL